MSTEQPETLSEILAEMRDERIIRLDGADVTRCLLHNLADRIEAAAERERIELREDEAKMLLREYAAAPDESLTPSALELKRELLRLAPAPGNAAAMREALEWAEQFLELGVDDDLGADGQNLTTAAEMARAALAAPARNCDRFATAEEAVAAFADRLREWENAHGVCSEYPDHPVAVPAGAFAWLFAPANKDGAR